MNTAFDYRVSNRNAQYMFEVRLCSKARIFIPRISMDEKTTTDKDNIQASIKWPR